MANRIIREYYRLIDDEDSYSIYTIDEWIQSIENGIITPRYGYGSYVKDDLISDSDAFIEKPLDATHVIFYTKTY